MCFPGKNQVNSRGKSRDITRQDGAGGQGVAGGGGGVAGRAGWRGGWGGGDGEPGGDGPGGVWASRVCVCGGGMFKGCL